VGCLLNGYGIPVASDCQHPSSCDLGYEERPRYGVKGHKGNDDFCALFHYFTPPWALFGVVITIGLTTMLDGGVNPTATLKVCKSVAIAMAEPVIKAIGEPTTNASNSE